MNLASVAAGVPPAVEGGVSPPGIFPGSWPVSGSFSKTPLSLDLHTQDSSALFESDGISGFADNEGKGAGRTSQAMGLSVKIGTSQAPLGSGIR